MPGVLGAMFQHLEEAQTLSFCYKSVSPCGPSGQATPATLSCCPQLQPRGSVWPLQSDCVSEGNWPPGPSPNLRGQCPWHLRLPLPQCNWQKSPFGLLDFLPGDCVWNEWGAVGQPLCPLHVALPEITLEGQPPSVIESPLWPCVPGSAGWGPGQAFADGSWLWPGRGQAGPPSQP